MTSKQITLRRPRTIQQWQDAIKDVTNNDPDATIRMSIVGKVSQRTIILIDAVSSAHRPPQIIVKEFMSLDHKHWAIDCLQFETIILSVAVPD